MKDYFVLFGVKPSSSDGRLVVQIQSALGNPEKRKASSNEYLTALHIFSNAHLSKYYRASSEQKNIPPRWKATLEREILKVEKLEHSESEIVYHFKESSFWLANFWFILGRCLFFPLSRKNNAEAPGRHVMRLIFISVGIQLLLFHALPIALMTYASPWFALLYGAILFYLIRKEYYSAKMEHAQGFFSL